MNLEKSEENLRCGMVSIVGRPNAGKSTLLNTIVEEKVTIVSKIPQTTRNQVRGIYNDERGQIIFIDTPGVHMGRDQLDKFMNKTAYSTINDADCVIHLVDVHDHTGQEEEQIVKKLVELKQPIIIGLNKVDSGQGFIPEYIQLWERLKGKPITEIKNVTLLPLTARTGMNVDKLITVLYENLPVSPPMYPRDIVCDVPQKMVVADIIREKLLGLMRDEVPHSLAVIIEMMEPRKNNTHYIQALVLVEKNSHKPIVVGKNGQTLKKAGMLARKELEDLLEKKVYLELYVKIKRDWREDGVLLQEMGYDEF